MSGQEASTNLPGQVLRDTSTASSAKVIKPPQREIDDLRDLFSENFNPRPARHDTVCVLLLSWRKEDSDLDVQPEVDALRHVFKDKYGFQVDHELLDLMGENPQTKVNVIVAKFVDENNAKNALLIVYYAGHGMTHKGDLYLQGKAGARQTEIAAKKRSMAWSAAERFLDDLSSDVFVIFDCCYAGSLIGRSPSAFDYLAACAADERAATPGPKSFTTGLVKALEDLRKENRPFSSTELKNRIVGLGTVSKYQKPLLSPRVKGDKSDSPRVTITPRNLVIQDTQQQDVALGHYQQLDHDYVDLRFQFYRKLRPGDIPKVAQGLSRLLNNDLPDTADFPARHVYLKHKASYRNTIVPYAQRWLEKHRKSKTKPSSSPTQPIIAVTTSVLESYERVAEEDGFLSPATPRTHGRHYQESIRSVESDVTMTPTENSPLLSESESRDSSETDYGAMYHLWMFLRCLWGLLTGLFTGIIAWLRAFSWSSSHSRANDRSILPK